LRKNTKVPEVSFRPQSYGCDNEIPRERRKRGEN
jgi:hypothetical protein